MADGGAVEVEWQFEAPDLGAVERWLREQPSHAAIILEQRGEQTQRDTYLDTGGWSVFHADYTLRVRARDEGSEVTLKGIPPRRSQGPVSRAEYTEPGDLETVVAGDGPVGRRLALMTRGAALRPLFTIVTRRQTWTARRGETVLAEIVLDGALVESASGSTPLRRVEVEERTPGGLAALDALVTAARVECGLVPAAFGKFDAGVIGLGLDPHAPVLGSTEIRPDDRAVDRAYAVVRRLTQEFLDREGGTALGEEVEQLHDMRVATRRLRAVLRVFDQVLPDALMQARDEFRWIAQALGAVRDLDVQLEHYEALRREAGWAESTAIAPLITQFERQRETARAGLLEALAGDRYARLVSAMRRILLAGPPADAPEVASREEARRVITRRYRQFERDARALRRDSPRAQFHELRIRGKRLRYSLELFTDLYGRAGLRALTSLRALQDLLGELQDLATTDERLRDLVRAQASDLPPDSLVMIGRLLERHEDRAQAILRAFPRARRAVMRDFARLRRALRPPRPEPPEATPDPEDEAASGEGDAPSPGPPAVSAAPSAATGGASTRPAEQGGALGAIARLFRSRR